MAAERAAALSATAPVNHQHFSCISSWSELHVRLIGVTGDYNRVEFWWGLSGDCFLIGEGSLSMTNLRRSRQKRYEVREAQSIHSA